MAEGQAMSASPKTGPARYEERDGYAVITLNRPEKYNALNLALLEALSWALDRAEADDRVRAVVLTGAGRAFSAGADITEMAAIGSVADAEAFWARRGVYFERVARCEKPVIAAISGFALGGGLELAMQADIRICGQSSSFGQPEVRIGIMPGAGGTQRLPRLIGLGRALEWLLTGERMSAEEAFRVGLVNRVVPDGEVLEAAERLARTLAGLPPISLRYIKRCAREGLEVGLQQGLALERQAFIATLATDDRREGVSAFLEKRSPHFRGR